MAFALQFLMQKFKSFLLFFIGIFRRALCCFKRKRYSSTDSIPLTAIGVVPTNATNGSSEFDNWNNWEDGNRGEAFKPNSIQEHIELFRQQKVLARQKLEMDEQQENFFEDMTPRITKQTKVFLNNEDDSARSSMSRLALNLQGVVSVVSISILFVTVCNDFYFVNFKI